jgi:diaminopimelate decarboxylase
MKGTLEIGGIPALDIAEHYGTPLFVYDSDIIVKQYSKLHNAFNVPDLQIHYACKALSNINILKLFLHLGSKIDAVSIEEIKLCLLAGFNPSDILFTPNSVAINEYEKALELGVRLNIDNIETLEYFGHHYPDQPVGIRINPHIMAGGHKKISVGHIDSKFGISVHQLPLVRKIVNGFEVPLDGIHMHTGSDILDVQVFLSAADILFNVGRNFPEIKYLNFGSGFKVKYKESDIETDIEEFGKEMSQKFNKFCEEIGHPVTLMFEPGKFLVSESGYFLVKTNLIKQTSSTLFAGVNSGFNHLIRPMFYDSYHEILNISNPEGTPRIYSIVGYICETDTFGWNRKIPEIRVGDILAFRNAGAYSFMMASNYNSRLLPAEVLVHQGKHYMIRERQQFEDLIRYQTDTDIPFTNQDAALLERSIEDGDK